MGRAEGRHGAPRQGTPPPQDVPGDDPRISAEDRQIGASSRMQGYPSPIPGGKVHITNAPSVRTTPPIPDARPEYHDANAHGVDPGSATTRDRAEVMRGPNTVHKDAPKPPKSGHVPDRPVPVPVYIVEEGSTEETFRTNAPRHITLNASTGEPLQLVGRDRNRSRVLLLNESASSDIRFAQAPSDLTGGGGALLPWPSNSYLTLYTQDTLYAISADSGTPKISVISEHDQQW